jgi:uncharacterized protein
MEEDSTRLLYPTTPGERVEIIDALRGFALAGVCLANLGIFSFYYYLSNEQKADLPLPVVNSIINYIVYFFVDQKFWTLFSIMFGFGASIFISRANEAHKNGKVLYARRLMILLVFGLIHHIFLWNGDILVDYALTGFILLIFSSKRSASLAVWGIILGAFVSMILKILQVKLLPHTQELILKLDPLIMDAYSSGSYSRIITANLADLKMYYIYVFYALVAALGRFMVGYWIGQTGIISNIEKYTVFFKKVLRVCAWVGFPVMTLITIIKILLDLGILSPESDWKLVKYLLLIGSMAIGIFYATKFSLLYQNIKWKKHLSVFKEMGRMAFTNYLMQTIINIFIFNGIGFGLAGKIGPSIYIFWFIVLITGQILFSKWWLTRYRFGPVEWLWRSLTYKKWQPMIKELKQLK